MRRKRRKFVVLKTPSSSSHKVLPLPPPLKTPSSIAENVAQNENFLFPTEGILLWKRNSQTEAENVVQNEEELPFLKKRRREF